MWLQHTFRSHLSYSQTFGRPLKSIQDGNKRSRYEAHFNQATEKDKEIGCSNNKASAQQMDDMMIEYNSGDICGDLV